jgi:DNA polymerase-3 subunit epsilon
MNIFWFDTETSGLNNQVHGIIQLAYILEVNGENKESGVLYSNCEGKAYNEKALAVNGFTPEQVKTFPHWREMYKSVKGLITKYMDPFQKDNPNRFIVAGQNVGFDIGFLFSLWKDNQDDYFYALFQSGTIDLQNIVRWLNYKGFDIPLKINLLSLADYFQLPWEGEAHDALADIKMTQAVARAIVDRYIRNKPRPV